MTYQAPEDRWRDEARAKPLGLWSPPKPKPVFETKVRIDSCSVQSNHVPIYYHGDFVGVMGGTATGHVVLQGTHCKITIDGELGTFADVIVQAMAESEFGRLRLEFEP